MKKMTENGRNAMNNTNENEEITMNEKKTIIDLVNKIRYEVTEEQLAELAGCATPIGDAEFVDWHDRIDNLELASGGGSWLKGETAAQLRELLHRVVDVTRKIGGKAVRIGKRIVKWIFAMLGRFPTTVAAAVVMAALAFVIGQIPYLGVVLLPIAKLVAAGIVGLVFLNECVTGMRIQAAVREAR